MKAAVKRTVKHFLLWGVLAFLGVGLIITFVSTVTTIGGGSNDSTCTEEETEAGTSEVTKVKSNEEFFTTLGPQVIKYCAKHRVPASVTLAQLAHESYYGQSNVAKAVNNLGGIKWSSSSEGLKKCGYKSDQEAPGHGDDGIYAGFKTIDKYLEYYYDYQLKGNKVYGITDVTQFVTQLKKTGYFQADLETYLSRVKGIIKAYKLETWDKQVEQYQTDHPDAVDSVAVDANDTGTVGSNDDEDKCGADDDDDTTNSGNIVKTAQSLIGYFTYQQSHGVSYIGSVENPKKDGVTDCSGFVWLVLAKSGFKAPYNMGWFTGTMESDAKGAHKYLKEVSEDDARPGDVVIVNCGAGAGDNGHTAIITSKWKGNDTTIINESGPNGVGRVRAGTFGQFFSSLMADHGKKTLARAIPGMYEKRPGDTNAGGTNHEISTR